MTEYKILQQEALVLTDIKRRFEFAEDLWQKYVDFLAILGRCQKDVAGQNIISDEQALRLSGEAENEVINEYRGIAIWVGVNCETNIEFPQFGAAFDEIFQKCKKISDMGNVARVALQKFVHEYVKNRFVSSQIDIQIRSSKVYTR